MNLNENDILPILKDIHYRLINIERVLIGDNGLVDEVKILKKRNSRKTWAISWIGLAIIGLIIKCFYN